MREVIERCSSIPLPPDEPAHGRNRSAYPGGTGNVSRGEALKRGVGFAVGFKNVAYSEGFDDSAEATVTLAEGPDGPVAGIHTAAVDFGQGLYTVLTQIVRSELGVEEVVVHPADTRLGSAGSTSASRQTTMTGGAVLEACRLVREELRRPRRRPLRAARSRARPGTATGRPSVSTPKGRASIHVAFSFVAERAVVEVDEELGLVRVVQMAAAQDIGRVMNPQGAEGQVGGRNGDGHRARADGAAADRPTESCGTRRSPTT